MKAENDYFAFIGTRTTRERNARGKGIGVFRVNGATGALSHVHTFGDLVNPSFLALSKNGTRLYTVHGDFSEVSAFALDAATGQLQLLNMVTCQGRNPVHLALSPDEGHLVVSNHLSSQVAVLGLDKDGRLGDVLQLLDLPGEVGPHRKEQPFAKPHFNPFSPCGRWVIVPDKGLDQVFVFGFDATTGRLQPSTQGHINVREGAGPRNSAFHPSEPWVYVVNELDSTVLMCQFDARTGALTAQQWASTLPDTYVGNSRAGSIAVSPSGRFVYASNRGHDSVTVLAVNWQTGHLTPVQTLPSGGQTPRFMCLSPCGRWCYALNEDSDRIVAFAVDAMTGKLTALEEHIKAFGSPVCMIFAAARQG